MSEPRFLDTNLVIRYITQDDPIKAQQSRLVFDRLMDGTESAIINHIVVFECVYLLQKTYGMPRAEVRLALETMLSIRNLRVSDRADVIEALAMYDERNIPFADAYIAVFMRRQDIREIYSWDRDFERIPWIRRVEPH